MDKGGDIYNNVFRQKRNNNKKETQNDKKILFLGLALILTIILLPTTVLGSSLNDVNAAQKAAQHWVNSIADECAELTQWQGAAAISPQPYENLDGKVNAYMFTVSRDNAIVGHILVGSADYDYDLFEAGEAAPMSIPSSDKAILAIESLGVTAGNIECAKPVKLLYLGLDNKHAIYNAGDIQIAVSLESGKASLLTDLKFTKLSPADYQTLKKTITQKSDIKQSDDTAAGYQPANFDWKKPGDKGTAKTLSGSGYGTITMSYFNQLPDRIWCGPCAGVSIMRHYRDSDGYSRLPADNTMYDDLDTSMTVPTTSTEFGSGIEALADAGNYETFNEYLNSYVTFSDYESVVNDLINDYPTGLLTLEGEDHWRGIRGYSYNTNTNYYRVICTNSANSQNSEYINWLDMGWWNETVCIKDNG